MRPLRPVLRVARALVDSRGRGLAHFLRSLAEYRRRAGGAFSWRDLNPVLHNVSEAAGYTSGHYFHQDLWAARKIYDRRPAAHVDVGSQIGGFVSHLLTFMEVTCIDVRPMQDSVWGLRFVQDDATEMRRFADGSVDSLSSLHAIEHFGLGRYGDPVDPDGHRKALRSFARVLSPGGRLYLGVPIGRERVEFNACRVLAPATVLEAVGLPLLSFSAVDDEGNFHEAARPDDFRASHMACGLFEFTKPA